MGAGASRAKVFGISEEDHLLYSPTLLDLEHGTIRHRDKELVDPEEEDTVRQGYFYHTRMPDWTDDNSIKEFQKRVVVKGSEGKLFYVYGMGLDADTEDNGIVRVKPKPKGLGYRWRGNSEHRYFRLRFSKKREDEESDSETEEVQGYQTVYRFHPKSGLAACDLSEAMSLKVDIPPDKIHIIYKTDRIKPFELVELLTPYYEKSKLELRMMTDVEIVKYDYDSHEFAIPAEQIIPPQEFEIPGEDGIPPQSAENEVEKTDVQSVCEAGEMSNYDGEDKVSVSDDEKSGTVNENHGKSFSLDDNSDNDDKVNDLAL